MRTFTDHLVCDFLGGPRPWKFSWVINFQKAGTFLFLLALIAWYDNMSTGVWIYTAMQGSYGLVWILKDTAFPDPGWQRRLTIQCVYWRAGLVLGIWVVTDIRNVATRLSAA
jgi:hypothetical protein